ncbi:energy-coupling factor ABC transporter ATP-binding protein [Azonexus sp.]|uniref:energy-coupling factor ABC transporter ATP-binding protein n=1 Tax=Azonexus sp. TaxID=1872668 RepID=UPI0035AE5B54
MPDALLEFTNVAYAWPDGRPVFADLSFRIAAGEKVVLLGANGAGKSTLLRLANGLLPPSGGSVAWQGRSLSPSLLRQRDFARDFRQANVLLFQHPEAMLFNPTVREEIAYGPQQLGLADSAARVDRWAAELGLQTLLDAAPFTLSGGQKQKVALACLLALDPQFLALDEPSASLDPATVGWLIDTLLDSGRTLLISTHNLGLAAELGERALILDGSGRLLYDGPLEPALGDLPLLLAAGLAHRHRHRHGGATHAHLHVHDWESS